MDDETFYAGFRDVLPEVWSYDGLTPVDEEDYLPVSEAFIHVLISESKSGRSLAGVAAYLNRAESEDEDLAVRLSCGLVPSIQMRFQFTADSDAEYQAMKSTIYPHLSSSFQSIWRHWEEVEA